MERFPPRPFLNFSLTWFYGAVRLCFELLINGNRSMLGYASAAAGFHQKSPLRSSEKRGCRGEETLSRVASPLHIKSDLSARVEGLFYVVYDVGDVFKTDGEADHSGVYAGGGELLVV